MQWPRPTTWVFVALAVCAASAGLASGQCESGWTQLAVSGPPGLHAAATAYNPITERMVLFGGGYAWEQETDDTWEWNGTAWTRVATTGPAARQRHSLTFEESTGRIILFGGYSGYTYGHHIFFNDTWGWDGSAWTLLSTSGPLRDRHASGVDPITREVMIFGGASYGGPYRGETWAWNGASWRLVSSSGPPGRGGATISLDDARGRAVLFGGFNESGTVFNDTWEWDGASWTQRFPAHRPSPRMGHVSTYDSARDRVVIFGGRNTAVGLNDTWSWDGTDWTQEATSGPSPRVVPVMAYGEALGGCVLFGGLQVGDVWFHDTWLYGGGVFISTQPAPQSTCPGGSAGFAVTAAGASPITYQWRMNNVPIDPVVNPSATTATLTLTNVQADDDGFYDCIVTNECGSITSSPAKLTICRADWNCADGVDSQDFFDFIEGFFAGDADFNGVDGTDSQDYIDFLEAFFSGC